MDILLSFLPSFVSYGSHVFGIIFHPYATYRHLVERGRTGEVVYSFILCCFYFSLASLVKTATFRPFLLTRQFVLLSTGAGMGYIIAAFSIYEIGKYVGGKGTLPTVFLAWGYTLIPTVLWFLATSLLYVILPPPRTEAVTGILFSFFYLVFSAVLFFWKAELFYLTLRFAMRLDLFQILRVSAIVVPILGLYSLVMYWMGIFKVPFL